LAALVANSCRASAKLCTSRGAMETSGPLMTMRRDEPACA
jgi:hypothetical protein